MGWSKRKGRVGEDLREEDSRGACGRTGNVMLGEMPKGAVRSRPQKVTGVRWASPVQAAWSQSLNAGPGPQPLHSQLPVAVCTSWRRSSS